MQGQPVGTPDKGQTMNELAMLRQVLPAATSETDALPHNIEAEQQLLGAILTNNEVYDRISSVVRPEHFFDPVHQRLFERAAARIQKNALASPGDDETLLRG